MDACGLHNAEDTGHSALTCLRNSSSQESGRFGFGLRPLLTTGHQMIKLFVAYLLIWVSPRIRSYGVPKLLPFYFLSNTELLCFFFSGIYTRTHTRTHTYTHARRETAAMIHRATAPTFSLRGGSEKPKSNSGCFYNDLFRNRLQLFGEILWLLGHSYKQDEPTLDIALHGYDPEATVEVLLLAFDWRYGQG